MEFPNLTAEDIEVRCGRVTEKRVELLLYKDARCDMRILDETVGPENWQRRHEVMGDTTFCAVGIKVGDEWVWKQDCGSAGNFEAEKSAASDAFKRACFNWGIGRELYTAPKIAFWVEQDGQTLCNVRQGKNGNWQTFDRFDVKKIVIEDHVIKRLWIVNESKVGDVEGQTVFLLNPVE